jgi:hypothetical protein
MCIAIGQHEGSNSPKKTTPNGEVPVAGSALEAGAGADPLASLVGSADEEEGGVDTAPADSSASPERSRLDIGGVADPPEFEAIERFGGSLLSIVVCHLLSL